MLTTTNKAGPEFLSMHRVTSEKAWEPEQEVLHHGSLSEKLELRAPRNSFGLSRENSSIEPERFPASQSGLRAANGYRAEDTCAALKCSSQVCSPNALQQLRVS